MKPPRYEFSEEDSQDVVVLVISCCLRTADSKKIMHRN